MTRRRYEKTIRERSSQQLGDRHRPCRSRLDRCVALEMDDRTRCGRPAQSRHRCQDHQVQYKVNYFKYKEASRRAEELLMRERIPSEDEIERYRDLNDIERKAQHVYRYLEFVQIERIGRDLHGRRFFLHRDFPHLNRIRMLEMEEKRSSAAFLALKERALKVSWEDYLRKILLFAGSEVAADTPKAAASAGAAVTVNSAMRCPTPTLEMNLGDSSVHELYEYFLSK